MSRWASPVRSSAAPATCPPRSSAGTKESPRSVRRKARGGALVLASVAVFLLLLGGGALASGLVGLPQDGSVTNTLSRMNLVETELPTPPQNTQGEANTGAADTGDEPQ